MESVSARFFAQVWMCLTFCAALFRVVQVSSQLTHLSTLARSASEKSSTKVALVLPGPRVRLGTLAALMEELDREAVLAEEGFLERPPVEPANAKLLSLRFRPARCSSSESLVSSEVRDALGRSDMGCGISIGGSLYAGDRAVRRTCADGSEVSSLVPSIQALWVAGRLKCIISAYR